MIKFEESDFYKLIQDFFVNNDKKTFIQFLGEFYNRTQGIIDKNIVQDDLIKELLELYFKFNEEGIDENIVREKIDTYIHQLDIDGRLNRTLEHITKKVDTEINEAKTDFTNKFKNFNNDKRVFKPAFGHCVDWSSKTGEGYNWSEEQIKKEIDELIEFGIEELSVTIQTQCRNGNVTLVSDLNLFKTCLDYAKEKGLNTKMIKIHCNEFREEVKKSSNPNNLYNKWCTVVETVTNSFQGICNYFIPINEGEHIFTDSKHTTFLYNCLLKVKEKGFKCGFSASSAEQWEMLPSSIKTNCDFVCFNCYPSISLKGLKTSYNDVVNALDEYLLNNFINKFKEEYNKEVFITEIGCEDRESCLACTYVWDFGNGEIFNNGEVQKIMLKGVFEYLKDNDNLSGIYYWYPFRGNAVKPVISYYVGGGK